MANPSLDQGKITARGALFRDDNGNPVGWNYTNITTQTTTLIKTGAGILHAITFNKPANTGTLEADDALTNTTPKILTITSVGSVPVTDVYDIAFTTGLSITTGTANQDITVAWI